MKNLLTVMNERGSPNKIYIELATEFLHSLMESANNIISISCKSFINEFFDQSVRIIKDKLIYKYFNFFVNQSKIILLGFL